MTKHVAIAAVLCTLVGTASAQDVEEGSTEETPTEDAPVAEPATTSNDVAPTSAGAGGAPKWGIEVGFNTAGDEGALHGLMNLGGSNYLDLAVLTDFVAAFPEDEDQDATSTLNVSVLAGFRMYKPLTGKIRPFLEPFGSFTYLDDADDAPDLGDDPIIIGVGAALGVDFELFEQFTLGTAVGARASFAILDGGQVLAMGLFTNAIRASFWW